MLVVVNDALMDQHQSELAEALAERGYLHFCRPATAVEALESYAFDTVKPYPRPTDNFAALLDQHTGVKSTS